MTQAPNNHVDDPPALIARIVECCVSEPRRAIELGRRLDHDRLGLEEDIDVHHALATAWWYVDRVTGREVLARMWRRHGASGRLFTVEMANLLAHYEETWASVSNNADGGAPDPQGSAEPKPGEVSLGIIGGQRQASPRSAIRSFFAHCSDLEHLHRRICVAPCPAKDRAYLAARYPWLDLQDYGSDLHSQLHGLLAHNRSPLLFLIDADHEFFATSAFISRCRLGVLSAATVGQCLINLGYARSEDARASGGIPYCHRGHDYVAHVHSPKREDGAESLWPHFCLRPSLIRAEVLSMLLESDASSELEMAQRYTQAGWISVFLPGVYYGLIEP